MTKIISEIPYARLRVLRTEATWTLTISSLDRTIYASLHQVSGRVALQRIAEAQSLFRLELETPNGMPKTRRSATEISGSSADDSIIRKSLKSYLLLQQPGIVIWDEFSNFGGWARLDLATVSDTEIVAYEIKSARDTLTRLPKQVMASEMWADRAFFVAAPAHIVEAIGVLPDWWGVWAVDEKLGGVTFNEVKTSSANQNPERVRHLLEYLSRAEAKSILKRMGINRDCVHLPEHAPVHEMRNQLLSLCSPEEISGLVRNALMNRNQNQRLSVRNRSLLKQLHDAQTVSWLQALERIRQNALALPTTDSIIT